MSYFSIFFLSFYALYFVALFHLDRAKGESKEKTSRKTKKSSCVNVRGIPTAAYQVLHLLPKVGSPPAGVPPPPARSDWRIPEVGYPLAGVPPASSDGGTQGGVHPPQGYAPLPGLTPSPSGPGRDTLPPIGYPPPIWTWLGYPPPHWVPPSHLDLAGVPHPHPPSRCGQTDGWTDTCQNITFPWYYVRDR